MPKVMVVTETKGKARAAFAKVRKYVEEEFVFKELGNFKPEVEWDTKSLSGKFKEKGVAGTISVEGTAPCKIIVMVELPFLMTPLQGVVKRAVSAHLERLA